MQENFIRLAKVMSQRNMCSRREAEQFIELGQVLVNGQIIDRQGVKIQENAIIELLPQAQKQQSKKVTILLNKPIGYVSTQPEKDYLPAIDLINAKNQIKQKNSPIFHSSHIKKLSVVGRLDIDSKGLLIFTQDGVLAKKIIGPKSSIEKEYLVYFMGQINEDIIKKLSFGLSLDKKKLKPAKISLIQPNVLKFILTEGKKRQIRRMCDFFNLRVKSLKRVRIGNICLGDLPTGKWRFLQKNEAF